MGACVLHCYADHKWTGPSEPVLRLCQGLGAIGWESELACMAAPDGKGGELCRRAAAAGLAVHEAFGPGIWHGLRSLLRDGRALGRLLGSGRYRLVHCHGSWDHTVAGLSKARRRAGIPLVRTDHGAREYRGGPLERLQFGPLGADHLIVLSEHHAVLAVNWLGRDTATVSTVRGAVDAGQFAPLAPPAGQRERLGLAEDDVVIGVVARVQPHRRFDVLLRAAQIVKGRDPRVRIAVCGRGSHHKRVLADPVRKMGLEAVVLPLGYRGDDYKGTLATFDAGLMLVPGSDGSCRAALQMAAMAKPLIVARRGVLPDIVRDGETGIVVEDEPDLLAEAILEMAADPARRLRWGEAARRRMCESFSPELQAKEVARAYERLLGS